VEQAEPGRGHDDTIRLFSTLAVQAAVEAILPGFTEAEGIAVDAVFDPTTLLRSRMVGGDLPDVLIGVASALEELVSAAGAVVQPATVLARSGIGVAVPRGAEHPGMSTVEELVETLTAARSVAYSRSGASGIYFAGLLNRLGIADRVNSRATVVDKGFTALALLDGRADLAVQMLSELKFVSDVDVIGALPSQVQHHVDFAATTLAPPTVGPAAQRLVQFLGGPAAQEAYRRAGLEVPPWSTPVMGGSSAGDR
jgi:ABC-type molybdate transport system substrate-binding protein